MTNNGNVYSKELLDLATEATQLLAARYMKELDSKLSEVPKDIARGIALCIGMKIVGWSALDVYEMDHERACAMLEGGLESLYELFAERAPQLAATMKSNGGVRTQPARSTKGHSREGRGSAERRMKKHG